VRRRKILGPGGKELDVVELTFQNAREHWNEYLLDDGTILKLKPVATEVFRVEGQYDGDGNPVYVLRSNNVLVVQPQDNMRRPDKAGGGSPE
jgi:hypothetical protein